MDARTFGPAPDAGRGLLTREFLASRWLHALLVFALCFCVSGYSILHKRQLFGLEGMTDEWYNLGINLAVYGTLGIGPEPIALRPPGYPFFVAVTLRTLTGSPSDLVWDWDAVASGQRTSLRGVQAVYLAQSTVLALTASLLYLWLSGFLRTRVAMVAALAFGLNPYCVVLAGLLHYDVLHWLALVAGCWALDRALRDPACPPGRFLVAGVVWGLATLVRPVTLLLPFFLLVALVVRRSTRRAAALRAVAVFTGALALTLVPWAARNYAVTGRLIPVNEQSSAAIWGSTVRKLGVHPNHYKWALLSPEINRIFHQVTGQREFNYIDYVRFNSGHEAVFREELARNLRRSPEVYVDNVLSGFLSFTLHINSVWLKAFQYLQTPGARLRPAWFEIGHPQDFHSGTTSQLFAAYTYVLTALAAAGAALAWRTRNARVLAPAAVFLCLGIGHALTYMDLMYYYQRVPFLYVFAAFLVDAAEGWRLPVPLLAAPVPVGRVLGPFLLSVVALTAWIL